MSLYEPQTAESNEAFHTTPNYAPSYNARNQQTAEVILRLPDLNEIDEEFEEAIDAANESRQDEDIDSTTPSKSQKVETDKTSRFAIFSSPKLKSFFALSKLRAENDRTRRIINIAVMLLLALLLGFGVARITDRLGFYGDSPDKVTEHYPAPDAPAAPAYKPPQHVSSEALPVTEAPESRLSTGTIPPRLDITTQEPALGQNLYAPADRSANQQKNGNLQNTQPETPNLSPKGSFEQLLDPRPSTQADPNLQQHQTYPPITNQGAHAESVNPNMADRFSPDRIQEVLNNRQGSVQTIRYPETQPSQQNSSLNYQPIQTPTTAPYQATQAYPIYAGQTANYPVQGYPAQGYPVQGSPATVPPISPYPPNGVYQTPSGHTTQTWPAVRTSVPPSTTQPYGQPAYPPNGYGYPTTNAVAQPPIDTDLYR